MQPMPQPSLGQPLGLTQGQLGWIPGIANNFKFFSWSGALPRPSIHRTSHNWNLFALSTHALQQAHSLSEARNSFGRKGNRKPHLKPGKKFVARLRFAYGFPQAITEGCLAPAMHWKTGTPKSISKRTEHHIAQLEPFAFRLQGKSKTGLETGEKVRGSASLCLWIPLGNHRGLLSPSNALEDRPTQTAFPK